MKKNLNNPILHLVLCFFIFMFLMTACQSGAPESHGEEAKVIKKVMQEYREAWLRGDTMGIMKTISPDIILFQSGPSAQPIIGKNALRDFWFPATSASYPILKYKIEDEDIHSSDDLAYYQGVSKLTWCTLENGVYRDTMHSVSEFTNILTKENGQWKLNRIMFVRKDADYERTNN